MKNIIIALVLLVVFAVCTQAKENVAKSTAGSELSAEMRAALNATGGAETIVVAEASGFPVGTESAISPQANVEPAAAPKVTATTQEKWQTLYNDSHEKNVKIKYLNAQKQEVIKVLGPRDVHILRCAADAEGVSVEIRKKGNFFQSILMFLGLKSKWEKKDFPFKTTREEYHFAE
jgi:hypothetical protein